MRVLQICEVCYKNKATSITHNKIDNMWYFCCRECLSGEYSIDFGRIDDLDWIEHLYTKGWVDIKQVMPKILWVKRFVEKREHHIKNVEV